MGLIDLKTDLKSLRFGKDRIGGGSSNQPYITKDIPEGEDGLGMKGGPDFLLRGGLLTPGRIVKDVSRLTQMFFDFKSPNGLLFTAKQNVLSRTAVATEASGKILNEGAYLPTSTLLGAVGSPLGLHLNKQGLDPTKRTGPDAGQKGLFDLLGIKDPLGLPVYNEVVTKTSKSRLETYLSTKQAERAGTTVLYEYNGGPGSILGVGKTIIPLSKERTGINNPNLNYNQLTKTYSQSTSINSLPGWVNFSTLKYEGSTYLRQTPIEDKNVGIKLKYGVSNKYFSIIPDQTGIRSNYNNIPEDLKSLNFSVYKPNSLDPSEVLNTKFIPKTQTDAIFDSKVRDDKKYRTGASTEYQKSTTTNNQEIINSNFSEFDGKVNNQTNSFSTPPDYIEEKDSSKFNPKIGEDFRIKNGSPTKSFPYEGIKRLDTRVHLGDPGKKFDRVSYNKGRGTALDKINALPLYKSSNIDVNKDINDFVKFRIGIIDNDNPDLKTYIHFRAIIDGMSDDYSAEWEGQKFMGRGEKLYRYKGFDRSINLSWTVVAQSKQELIPMYQKLNYLASACAPSYSDNGYMRGNLIELTVGGYLFNQVGIMGSISYTIPEESPWEIAIGDNTENSNENNQELFFGEKSVKELPHMIKVSGFKFTPIHNFVPNLQQNVYSGSANTISSFGKERYIALENGDNNNYDNYNGL